MLPTETIEQLLAMISQQEVQLTSYQPANIVYLAEAHLAIFEIKTILLHPQPTLVAQLKQTLANRWLRIQNTNCQYLHDFTSPANTSCIALASSLQQHEGDSALSLLMPTLKKVPPSSYLTSSYDDDNVSLKEIILNDTNERIINVVDVLDSAQEDGVLKHNSMFLSEEDNNNPVRALSTAEVSRLLSRHPSVKALRDNIISRVLYRLEGDTVGAELNRLIHGLRNGGAKVKTSYENAEYNSSEFNSGVDANLAILNFSLYLETLDPETKKQLMSTGKVDRYETFVVEKKTIQMFWDRLSKPNGLATESIYCVELIATFLEEILNANPGLYDLVPFQGSALGDLTQLNANVVNTEKTMKEALAAIQLHPCYDVNSSLMSKILDDSLKVSLPLKITQLLIQIHLKNPSDSLLLAGIAQIVKINDYPSSEYQAFSTEEKNIYLKLKPIPIIAPVSTNQASLFSRNKRKLGEVVDEKEQEKINQEREKPQRIQISSSRPPR